MRHYAPNIDSYLYRGVGFPDPETILIDFAGLMKQYENQIKYYRDLSESGNYLQAIANLYEVLRWAETKTDAKLVLITDIMTLAEDGQGFEYKEALYDRIYRATSGRFFD